MHFTPPVTPPGAPALDSESRPTPISREQMRELNAFTPPEALTTLDEHGARRWVYPAPVSGFFVRARRNVAYVLIAILFGLPWIKIGGMPAIWLQIEERRFIVFGHIFWPQDMIYLALLLLGLAMCLFFFTALIGRVWCGWACPQTVFLEHVFRKVEEWIEGDHRARIRLDGGPLTISKALKKTAKHAVFLAIAALVSNTFLAYFVGADRMLRWIIGLPSEHWTAFLIMSVTLAVFYFDFAWFREQFCVVVCPYARFQAVLTDPQTVQVGYDVLRGEPRGHLGSTKGDCIDCHRCVAVCPTGIDIRVGFQLECIGCARCIDACDDIMARVGKARGLIRYDSMARLRGELSHMLRPRVVVYSVLLAGAIAALFIGLGVQPQLDLTVTRPAGEPFALLPGNIVSNHFTVRLINHAAEDRTLRLAVTGAKTAVLVTGLNPLQIRASEQARVEAFVAVPRKDLPGAKLPLKVQVFDGLKLIAEQATVFLAPAAP
jgi:cytochrome c oxidase accessory protein FixG